MPLAFHIDPERALVTISGDYAQPADWRVLLEQVREHPSFRPGLGFLRDLRFSEHPVSPEAVVGIIEVVRQLWAVLGARRAAMVTRPGIDLPAVIAHALAEDVQIPLRAFTSYDEAMEWLTGA